MEKKDKEKDLMPLFGQYLRPEFTRPYHGMPVENIPPEEITWDKFYSNIQDLMIGQEPKGGVFYCYHSNKTVMVTPPPSAQQSFAF